MVYLLVLVSILWSLFSVMYSLKYINILQLSGYKIKDFFEWVGNKQNKLRNVHIICLLALFLAIFVLSTLQIIIGFSVLYLTLLWVPMALAAAITYYNLTKQKFKKPLVITARVKRLVVTVFVVSLIVSLLVNLLILSNLNNYGMFMLITVYFMPITLVIAHCLVLPIEKMIANYYVRLAKNKLKSFSQLKVIAITGSYGKTSVKHILTALLKEKYFTVCTPHSFNTPMGITKSILSDLKTHHEYFVVEMGADKANDIKRLCKIIRPDYGVLTSVGNQHLKSFKTMTNLIKTKYQVMTNLKYHGIGFFNSSDQIVKDLYLKFEGKKCAVSLTDKNAYCYASQIKTTSLGSEFFVNINKRRFKLKTSLLGEHNITNILLAVAIGDYLGLNILQIKKAVAELKPVKHRLEMIKLNNGATLLDDSFNSNPNGALQAVKVLGSFADKNKIIITPGMVELGADSYAENFKFGKLMATVADKVYVVNQLNKTAIYNGLIAGGFGKENILVYDTFNNAFDEVKKLLSSDDVVLIENDLPDTYI